VANGEDDAVDKAQEKSFHAEGAIPLKEVIIILTHLGHCLIFSVGVV